MSSPNKRFSKKSGDTPRENAEGHPDKLTPELIQEKYARWIFQCAKIYLPRLQKYGYTQEDLVGEVNKLLQMKYHLYNPSRANPTTFIAAIAKSALTKISRDQGRLKRNPPQKLERVETAFGIRDRRKTAQEQFIHQEEKNALIRAIGSLSPQELYIVRQLARDVTQTEIAKQTGVSRMTINNIIKQIRQKISIKVKDFVPIPRENTDRRGRPKPPRRRKP